MSEHLYDIALFCYMNVYIFTPVLGVYIIIFYSSGWNVYHVYDYKLTFLPFGVRLQYSTVTLYYNNNHQIHKNGK